MKESQEESIRLVVAAAAVALETGGTQKDSESRTNLSTPWNSKKRNKTEDKRDGRNRKQRVRETRRNRRHQAFRKCTLGGYMRQDENKGAKN